MSDEDQPATDEALIELRKLAVASAVRFVHVDRAEDAAQQAIVDFLAKPHLVDTPEAWIRTAAKHKAIDELRREDRQAQVTDPNNLPERVELTDVEYEVERRRVVDNLIDFANTELKGPQQVALLALIESGGDMGQAVRLAADLTGRSVEAMRTHLRRAREKARGHFGDDPGAVA